MSSSEMMALFTVTTFIGYAVFHLTVLLLLTLEKHEAKNHKKTLIKEAKTQHKHIIDSQKIRNEQHFHILHEELHEQILQTKSELITKNEELNEHIQRNETNETFLQQRESTYKQKQKQNKELLHEVTKAKEEHNSLSETIVTQLEKQLNQTPGSELKKQITEITDRAELAGQKRLKLWNENLNSSSSKQAKKTLLRTLHRYEPTFIWPKPLNTFEITNDNFIKYLHSSEIKPLKELEEISQTELHWAADNPTIRLSGGYGISKEAVKRTLVQLNKFSKNSWTNPTPLYQDNFKKIEKEAIILGKKAVNQLDIKGLHPELQKLIGALYWRTSYRQNQWFHTVEVATIGGMLAEELGIDQQEARRVGLLHDIGKVLDYRIEGSHAIISADYADRYGESKLICDTVLSHHSDLVLETPLSYVLRTADALSGARPGARVNIEEGYQIRISAIQETIQSFAKIHEFSIMSGGREVHIQVDFKKVSEHQLPELANDITKKIQENVTFPGQIKILISRTYESSTVA